MRPKQPPPCPRCGRPKSNARTVLERHRVSQEQIAGEEQAARVALGEAQRRIGQIRQDLAHADQLQRDAAAADQRLAEEATTLAEADAGHDERAAAAEAATIAAADAVRVAEAEANRATEAAAEANARAQAAAQLLAQAEHRSNRLNEQARTIGQERERVAAQQVDPAVIARAAAEAAEAEAALTAARSRGRTGGTGARRDRRGAGVSPGKAGHGRIRPVPGWRPRPRRWPRCWR